MSTIDTIRKDLIQMVQTHDWSYMMSDSHSVWEVGMRHEKEIQAKVHALCAIHREDAEALYTEVKGVGGLDYSDRDSSGRGLKYRVIHSWFAPYIQM